MINCFMMVGFPERSLDSLKDSQKSTGGLYECEFCAVMAYFKFWKLRMRNIRMPCITYHLYCTIRPKQLKTLILTWMPLKIRDLDTNITIALNIKINNLAKQKPNKKSINKRINSMTWKNWLFQKVRSTKNKKRIKNKQKKKKELKNSNQLL